MKDNYILSSKQEKFSETEFPSFDRKVWNEYSSRSQRVLVFVSNRLLES